MRRYETIIIIDPDTSDEGKTSLLDKVSEIIPAENGVMVLIDDWGMRKLAYEVKKKNRGHYVRFDYCGSGDLVNEMERSFRIDDRVMKYMTVLLEKDADAEAIKEEIAKAKAEKEAKKAEAMQPPAEKTDETIKSAEEKPVPAAEEAVAEAPEEGDSKGAEEDISEEKPAATEPTETKSSEKE